MDNHIVESYIQNPIHNYLMEDADIEQHEGNPLCGDAITVHLKIQNNTITAYSYSGTYSSITGAAASFLGDIIIGVEIDALLSRNLQTIEKHGFIVSVRRKRAAIIAVLACKNAIYHYQKKGKRESFDDLLY